MTQTLITQIKNKITEGRLTPYSLEKKAGLKTNAVHNILSGRSKNPSIYIIHSIAKALNCSVSDLISEEIGTASSTDTNRTNATENETTLDNNLYIKCLSFFTGLLIKQNRILHKVQLLKCVDELYLYSFKRGLNKVDIHFAAWLLEKTEDSI